MTARGRERGEGRSPKEQRVGETGQSEKESGHSTMTSFRKSGWSLTPCSYLDCGNVKRRRDTEHRHYHGFVFLINIDLHFPNMWFLRHQRRVFIGHVRFASSGVGIKNFFEKFLQITRT